LIGSADNQDQPAYLSFDALNNIMKNMKAPQFDYDGFKVLYDTNPDLQPLVKNFDQDGVELSTKSTASGDDATVPQDDTGAVDKMAQRATSSALS
tara:strand:+ start:591 stop:875 length:285 start_codon:yes stop_codon:yes gene_type:complete